MNYLKCALANKIYISGILGLMITIVLISAGAPDWAPNNKLMLSISLYFNFCLILVTRFGLDTYSAYITTKEGLKRDHYVPNKGPYCYIKGYELAKKEMGL